MISVSSVVARCWHSRTNEHSGEELSLGVHAWPVLSGWARDPLDSVPQPSVVSPEPWLDTCGHVAEAD